MIDKPVADIWNVLGQRGTDMTERPRVSVVVPAYNEDEAIVASWTGCSSRCESPFEILVVYDSNDDTTVPVAESTREGAAAAVPVNTYGRGPANAIRFGIYAATAAVVVVTMADGCDDPSQVDELARLVERGVAVAAASRYMKGGQQIGGPF